MSMTDTEVIHSLMDILESLTPGGSEFKNNPKACHEWIKARLQTRGRVASERNQLRARVAEAHARFWRVAARSNLLRARVAELKRENDALKAIIETGQELEY